MLNLTLVKKKTEASQVHRMSGDFKEVKDNTVEVSDVAENGGVAKVGVSLTPQAMMRRVEPRIHDLFIV